MSPAELRLAVPAEGDDLARVGEADRVVWPHRHVYDGRVLQRPDPRRHERALNPPRQQQGPGLVQAEAVVPGLQISMVNSLPFHD